MANTTSIDIVRQGIADILTDCFPDAAIFDTPLQQKVTLPAFFLTVLPSELVHGVGWYQRTLFWDVSYLIHKNLTDTQTQLTAAQEILDLNLMQFNVVDPTDNTVSRRYTYERKGTLDLMAGILHYTFKTKEWMTIPEIDTALFPANLTLTLEATNGN